MKQRTRYRFNHYAIYVIIYLIFLFLLCFIRFYATSPSAPWSRTRTHWALFSVCISDRSRLGPPGNSWFPGSQVTGQRLSQAGWLNPSANQAERQGRRHNSPVPLRRSRVVSKREKGTEAMRMDKKPIRIESRLREVSVLSPQRLRASGRIHEREHPARSGCAARPRTYTIPKSLDWVTRKADAGRCLCPY
jgi:hypothetical protein